MQAFVKGYLLPTKLNPAHANLSPIHRDRLLRSQDQQGLLFGVSDVRDVLVLICGHGGRDMRCGITGPILRDEFERMLPEMDVQVLQHPVDVSQRCDGIGISGAVAGSISTARVGLISHIGGHKFAGNVIVYIPPGAKTTAGDAHPLAGCGIWYGRIEPKHVEGIINETILGGKVIADHFRGGVKQDGEILRL